MTMVVMMMMMVMVMVVMMMMVVMMVILIWQVGGLRIEPWPKKVMRGGVELSGRVLHLQAEPTLRLTFQDGFAAGLELWMAKPRSQLQCTFYAQLYKMKLFSKKKKGW